MPAKMVVCTECKGFGNRSGHKCTVCDGKGVFDPEKKNASKQPVQQPQPSPLRSHLNAQVQTVIRPTPVAAPPAAPVNPHPVSPPPAPPPIAPLPLYAEDPRLRHTLITVVIVSCNNVDGVLRTVRGSLNHSRENVEVLLIDDGSTDDTPRVSASITDSRFLVIRRPWQSGRDSARRLGIAQAAGSYLIMLDAGDVVDPKVFDSQLDEAPLLNLDAIENGALYRYRKAVL